MPVDLGTELDQAYQELRGIDSELATLGGRSGPVDRSNTSHRRVNVGAGQELSVGFDTSSSGTIGDRIARRRISMDPGYENSSSSYGSNDRRVQEVGGRRRIVVSTNNNNGDYDSARKRSHHDSEEYADYNSSSYQPPLKRTLQSSVVMPTIETKSRDATITEMKKSEKTGDAVRNRRMFSNLLVGTLRQFQKEEDSTKNKTQTQFEKQREVERRLERTDKENKNKIYKEKEELINRRREKEQQILLLKRKKAIIQYAEEKQKHLRRLQHFIQTQTKPPLFFLPAKHTLRTLELLKDSAKKVENLIELRQQEMEKELRRDVEDSEEEEDRAVGLKSAIVPVTKTKDSTEDKKSSSRYIRNPKKEALSTRGSWMKMVTKWRLAKWKRLAKRAQGS
uniref:Pinin/SDK/MemA protein domain-containing protein n=1 Tax=Ditylenchus dipsaci TaxID=166011 RepID=A0A915DPD8_9BILA